MENLRTEKLVSLAEAGRLFPVPASPLSCWRWARKGLLGIHLETLRIGGRIHTSAEAVARFVERTNEADRDNFARKNAEAARVREATKQPKRASSSARAKQIATAKRQLAAAGC